MDEEEKGKPLKRGRGSQRKTKALVMAESLVVDGLTIKNGKSRKVGHIKMFVIEDMKADAMDSKVFSNIDSEVVINSDHSTSYTKVAY